MAPALASYFPVSAWLLVPSALPVTGSAISAGSLLLLEVNTPTLLPPTVLLGSLLVLVLPSCLPL